MLKTFNEYVRTEWKYWVMAIALAMGMLMLGAQKSHARPILQADINDLQFYHDPIDQRWYLSHDSDVVNMHENFDQIQVVWTGRYHNEPLVLIAGQNRSNCRNNYRLYWASHGEIRNASDFGICDARHISVSIEEPYVTIRFDDHTKRVPLDYWQ